MWQEMHIHIPYTDALELEYKSENLSVISQGFPPVFWLCGETPSASVSGVALGPLPSHKFRIPCALALCLWQ